MTTNARIALGFCVTVIIMIGARSPLEAQCQPCDEPEPNTHHFHPWSCDEGSGCYDCEEGAPGHEGCHGGERAGDCDAWHLHCTPTLASDVMDSYNGRNVAHLAAFLIENAESYSLNPARDAIQGVDCRGAVAVHLPLDPVTFRQLSDEYFNLSGERQSGLVSHAIRPHRHSAGVDESR